MTSGCDGVQKQILVITSDSDALPVLKYLLIADGFRVVAKTGIKNVLNSLEQTKPGLVLLDLHASTGDAVRTFYAIRELNPHLPVLLLVESEFVHLAEHLMTDETRYILKTPIDYERLRMNLGFTLPDSTNIKANRVAAGYSGSITGTLSNSI